MADKEFLLANKARELMAYTYRATKPLAGEAGERMGFSKSAYRLYGADMRQTAKEILRDVHGANNCDFAVEYDKRLARISSAMDGCSLLLEYIQLCLDAKLISTRRAGDWTAKTVEVKRMAAGWKRGDSVRAAKLREADAAKRAALYKTTLLEALRDYKTQDTGE